MGDSDIETIQADVVDDEGILVIDEETAAPHGRPCSSCGAPVETGDRFCGSCGAPSQEELPDVVDEEEQTDRFLRCDNCGSEVRVDPDQRSYSCPFCESTVVVEFSPDLSTRQRPEFVIGFALNRDEAAEKFRQWLANDAWYRPKDLASATLSELRGVYVPFWNFSMLADSSWDASIGEYWYRTETYTTTDSKGNRQTKTRRVRETEWWPLSGKHHRYHSGYLVSGSKGLPQALADRIMPYQLPALKRYQPYFLAGWLSEEYSVERDAALQQCQSVCHEREKQNVAAFLPGDTHRSLAVRTSFSAIQSDLCLLPVYLLTYTYKQKVYRFCINGQTGKIAGDKPISWSRVTWTIVMFLAIGAGIAAVIALINFMMQR
jgi:DNA-directed RNA polymerase subunit RPC12/RpoP